MASTVSSRSSCIFLRTPSTTLLALIFYQAIAVSAFAGAFLTPRSVAPPKLPPTPATSHSAASLMTRRMAQASAVIHSDSDILSQLSYRAPTPDDIPRCYAIESASYPADEAATLEGLHYRQANARDYFQLCTIVNNHNEIILGFICATRCHEFTEESMSTHDPSGKLLAIHSVVVEAPYRKRGIAKAMLQHYVKSVKEEQQQSPGNNNDNQPPISSMVLLAKAHLLGFYVQCGFQVNRPSPIVHGQELWYELEQSCSSNAVRALPNHDESWFCKTEQFQRPFPEVKPYLEEHKVWVERLRQDGYCITSGYRVDAEGKPGGGGLMFLAATSYQAALEIVKQDPLVANDCVDWELNGWIGQVGDVQMR